MDEKNIGVRIDSNSTNKTFDLHKVFAAIGVILVVAIVILGGVWYFVEGQHTNSFGDEQNTTKVATKSVKLASNSATQAATKSAQD